MADVRPTPGPDSAASRAPRGRPAGVPGAFKCLLGGDLCSCPCAGRARRHPDTEAAGQPHVPGPGDAIRTGGEEEATASFV